MIHPVGVPMSLCPIAPPFATSHPGAHRRSGFLLYEKYSGFLASDVLEIMFHTLFVVFSIVILAMQLQLRNEHVRSCCGHILGN
jgi:hypothetical protein